jgi:hypothetical protein
VGLRPLVCFAESWYYTTVSKHQYTPLGGKKQTAGTRWESPLSSKKAACPGYNPDRVGGIECFVRALRLWPQFCSW